MQKSLEDYLNKHVMLQLIYFYRNNDFHLVKNFKEFSQKMKRSFNQKGNIWNIFDSDDLLDAQSVISEG